MNRRDFMKRVGGLGALAVLPFSGLSFGEDYSAARDEAIAEGKVRSEIAELTKKWRVSIKEISADRRVLKVFEPGSYLGSVPSEDLLILRHSLSTVDRERLNEDGRFTIGCVKLDDHYNVKYFLDYFNT